MHLFFFFLNMVNMLLDIKNKQTSLVLIDQASMFELQRFPYLIVLYSMCVDQCVYVNI